MQIAQRKFEFNLKQNSFFGSQHYKNSEDTQQTVMALVQVNCKRLS